MRPTNQRRHPYQVAPQPGEAQKVAWCPALPLDTHYSHAPSMSAAVQQRLWPRETPQAENAVLAQPQEVGTLLIKK